jgi:hypothetical protein
MPHLTSRSRSQPSATAQGTGTAEPGPARPPAPADLSGNGVRRACALAGPTPADHVAHALHGADSHWPARHRPVDLWIEVLAALGLDPHALWPCTVALDFEGDQWTSLQPPRDELRALYGIDVQELAVWRPLAEHVIEHLGAGRLLALEVDAFWLPDAASTDHRRNHAKTTLVLTEVDLDARRIAGLHGGGRVEARGDDVTHLLGLEEDTSDLEAIADWRGSRVAEIGAAAVALDEGRLAPHAEFMRLDRRVERSTGELRMLALHHLETHLAFRPGTNPVRRFAARLAEDLPLLRDYGPGYAAQWAAATVHPLGAAFELASRGLAWQDAAAGSPLHAAAHAFDRIARDAKTLDQKLARAVSSAKSPALASLLDGMAQAWDDGMGALDAALR